MFSLEGRVAIVTGAGRGIGRGIAEGLALSGAKVVCAARTRSQLDEVVASIESSGGTAMAFEMDMKVLKSLQGGVDAAVETYGQLDILVNNAGVGSAAINRPAVADASNEQWNTLLDVNLWGPIFLCRKLVPHMREAERSDVVMISSIAAQALNPGYGVYSVSKAALEAMAHTLAREEKSHGMRVNMIAPGLVDTDMGRKIVAATSGGAPIGDVEARMPFGFVCTADDIAATVTHLCSEDGRYITNQRITISGD